MFEVKNKDNGSEKKVEMTIHRASYDLAAAGR